MSLDKTLTADRNLRIVTSMMKRLWYLDNVVSNSQSGRLIPPADTPQRVADQLYRRYGSLVLGWPYNRLLVYYYRYAEIFERHVEVRRF